MARSWREHPVIAWVRLARPLIFFISLFGASVGALNVSVAQIPVNEGFSFSIPAYLVALLGAGLLSSGLMIHNDVTDYASDVVNRPHKPLPAGLIGKRTASIVGIGTMVAAVLAAGLTGPAAGRSFNVPCALFTLTIVIIGILYNVHGKYWGLLGHIFVAYGVGAIPLWGAWAVRPERLTLMLPLALAIFVMEIGREIMVCAGDIVGDRAAGFRTTPVRLGRLPSMRLALLFYLASVPFFLVPRYGWCGAAAIFGDLYLYGALGFLLVLFVTWGLTYRVAREGDDARSWRAFELYIRTGTRLAVVAFQIVLFLEALF
jgi:4-hydroxybenzoate polyprenyltransferase